MASALINEKISSHDVYVFSKSYCPFCQKAIKVLTQTFGNAVEVMHIEQRDDMDALQDELLKITGGRSVPRVFVKGKFVGGCDDVMALSDKGKLKGLLE